LNKTQNIIAALLKAGLKAFPPAVHEGLCRSPYCVVQVLSSALLCPSGGYVRYRVHLYVSAHRSTDMDALALSVRKALLPCETEGWLTLAQPCGTVSVSDAYRAAYSFIDYVSYYSEM